MTPELNSQGAGTLPSAYFDDIYGQNPDPWSFETSAYEAAKYAATLEALGDRRFAHAFEIGCSIGVLTEQLAHRCKRLLAVDVSEAPLQKARDRCAALRQVDLRRMAVPQEFPTTRFDLVLMSEVGYYWCAADLARAAQAIVSALEPGGLWLLVHWTPYVRDYPLTGDQVHEYVRTFAAESGLARPVLSRREASYRLDLWERVTEPAP